MNNTTYWIKINMNIIILLAENNLMMVMVTKFKTKFKKQFSGLIIEIAPVLFNIEMIELRQLSNELLLIYY